MTDNVVAVSILRSIATSFPHQLHYPLSTGSSRRSFYLMYHKSRFHYPISFVSSTAVLVLRIHFFLYSLQTHFLGFKVRF